MFLEHSYMQKKETEHHFKKKKLTKKHILQSYSSIGTHIVLIYNKDPVYQGQHVLMAWELKSGFSNPFAPLQ